MLFKAIVFLLALMILPAYSAAPEAEVPKIIEQVEVFASTYNYRKSSNSISKFVKELASLEKKEANSLIFLQNLSKIQAHLLRNFQHATKLKAYRLWNGIMLLNQAICYVVAGEHYGLRGTQANVEEKKILTQIIARAGIIEVYDIITDLQKVQSGKSGGDIWFPAKFSEALVTRFHTYLKMGTFHTTGLISEKGWDQKQIHTTIALLIAYAAGTYYASSQINSQLYFSNRKNFQEPWTDFIQLKDNLKFEDLGILNSYKSKEEKKAFNEFMSNIINSNIMAAIKETSNYFTRFETKLVFNAKLTQPYFYSLPRAIIEKSIEDYLKEQKEPKLLITCGHKPIFGNIHGGNIIGDFSYHRHDDWYAIDINPSINPDLVTDLMNDGTLAYLDRFKGQLKVVFPEYSVPEIGWDPQLLKKVYQNLRDGGVYINGTYPEKAETPEQVEKRRRQDLMIAGFKEDNIKFYKSHIPNVPTYSYPIFELRFLLKNYMDTVGVKTLSVDKLNAKEVLELGGKRIRKVNGLSKGFFTVENLEAEFARLKELKKITPMFEWGMMYEHYVIAVK